MHILASISFVILLAGAVTQAQEQASPNSCTTEAINDSNLNVQQKNNGVLVAFKLDAADSTVHVDFQSIVPSYENADVMRVMLQSTEAISRACNDSIVFERSGAQRLRLPAGNIAEVGNLYQNGSAGKALDVFAVNVLRADGSHFHLPEALIPRMVASFAVAGVVLTKCRLRAEPLRRMRSRLRTDRVL